MCDAVERHLKSLESSFAELPQEDRAQAVRNCINRLQTQLPDAPHSGQSAAAGQPDQTKSISRAPTDVGDAPAVPDRRLAETWLQPRTQQDEADDAVADGTLPAARRIGNYELQRVIGEGGMGTVYLAEQREPVQRVVAIKMSRAAIASDEVLQRFELERRSLAMMDHDGIARLLEAGQTRDGRPYFVMEYVSGSPVTEYCRLHQLSLSDRLELFVSLCDAIQHAHQRSIIHRDIKPGNVLVVSDSDSALPKIKVIDFGLARLLDAASDSGVEQTVAGQVLGTVRYMSPEQAAGSRRLIDTRSDVYSLGVLLYEMISGTTPIPEGELSGMSLSEALRQVQEQSVPAMSARLAALTDEELEYQRLDRDRRDALARQVRGDLDLIVETALQTEPEQRYQSVAAFSDDVQRFLSYRPVLARRPSIAYVGLRFLRRHRTAAFVTLLFAVLILAFAINDIRVERKNAALRIAAAEDQQRLSESEADLQLAKAEAAAAALRASETDRLIMELAGPPGQAQSLEDRLGAIREALQMKQLDASAVCDLRLAELEVLDSLLRYEELRSLLDTIEPVGPTQAARLQMWRVRASLASRSERSQAIHVLQSGGAALLEPGDQLYLQAMTSASRGEAIEVLSTLLLQWPRHTAGRKLLIGCLLFDGHHNQMQEHVTAMRVLQPGDPETEIAVALSLAMQESDEALRTQLQRLRQMLPDRDLQQLTVFIRDLSQSLYAVREWDMASGYLMDLLQNTVRFAGILQSFTDATSVLNARTGSLSAALMVGQPEEYARPQESFTIRFTARLVAVAAGMATDNYGPFRQLVDDLAAESPIRNDAFFPFLRGLTRIAGTDWERAVPEFEHAAECPCLFSRLTAEIDYCLAVSRMAWAREIEPETPEATRRLREEAAAAARRWEQQTGQFQVRRVLQVVDIYARAGHPDDALRLLRANQSTVPASAGWQIQELDLLLALERYAETIRRADQFLQAPTLKDDQPERIEQRRTAARQAIQAFNASPSPADGQP